MMGVSLNQFYCIYFKAFQYPRDSTIHCKNSRNDSNHVITANPQLGKTTGWLRDQLKVYGFYKDDLSISTFPSGPAKMKQLALDKNSI